MLVNCEYTPASDLQEEAERRQCPCQQWKIHVVSSFFWAAVIDNTLSLTMHLSSFSSVYVCLFSLVFCFCFVAHTSHFSGHTQFIQLRIAKSHPFSVILESPRDLSYLLPLGHISFHGYADDTQLYLSTNSTTTIPPTALSVYLQEIKSLFYCNLLK